MAFRTAVLGVLTLALSLLVVAAAVRHYRKSAATAALMQERFFVVPMEAPQLATFPQGLPGNGHSGRATNVEDYTDPYGGGDVPGPYGNVNDPWDGDWALGPLGGKAMRVQQLRAQLQQAEPEPNVWDADAMGTNSIFMGEMPASVAFEKQKAVAAAAAKAKEYAPPTHDNGLRQDPGSWVGTNEVFFGANGGGLGFARGARAQGLARRGARVTPVEHRQAVMKARMQTLFRSDDPHEAEYGREGPNQLDDSVLPSAIGSGGPVMGVDGLPSNVAHEWVHKPEEFSFACNPDIYGCETGLTVGKIYADS